MSGVWDVSSSENVPYTIQSSWNANTNTPDLSSVTTTGFAYAVTTAGSTNLGGISSWSVGDIAIKTSTGWAKLAGTTGSLIWGALTGTLSEQEDLQNALNLKASTAQNALKQDRDLDAVENNLAKFNATGHAVDSGLSIVTAVDATGTDLHIPTEQAVREGLNAKVNNTGDETIAGIKTFSSIPVLPSSSPTADVQATSKLYVDDRNIINTTGTLTKPALVDNGDGTCTIPSTEVHMYASSDFSGHMEKFTVPQATLGPFTDGEEEYIRIIYNDGSPVYQRQTAYGQSAANNSNVISCFIIWRQGNEIHSLSLCGQGLALTTGLQRALYYTQKYRVSEDDLPLIDETTSPAARTITIEESYVYTGGLRNIVSAFNSSVDRMTRAYHVAGVWTYVDHTQYDNTQYDNGTDLVTMTNDNRYAVRWFYRSIGDVKQTFYVLGREQHNSAAAAALESPRADLPELLRHHCLLIGRSIIARNAVSGITQTTLIPTYIAPAVIDHNDTLNIQGGATNEYYHLTSVQYANLDSQGDVAEGDYTHWDATGHQTMLGDARPWRDELGDVLNLRSSGPGVSVDAVEACVVFAANADLNDYLYKNTQFNHDRDSTAVVYPHIHFTQTRSAIPNFMIQYRWQLNEQSKTTAWTNLRCNVPEATYVSGSLNQIVNTPAGITPPPASVISDILQIRVIRDVANTSTLFSGAEPAVVPTVSVLSVDVHIQINSLGSTDQYTK